VDETEEVFNTIEIEDKENDDSNAAAPKPKFNKKKMKLNVINPNGKAKVTKIKITNPIKTVILSRMLIFLLYFADEIVRIVGDVQNGGDSPKAKRCFRCQFLQFLPKKIG